MKSTNPHSVAYMFRDYARRIHAKASLKDPNFLAICVMCGKIETWVEHHYPSFVSLTKETKTIQYDSSDPRSRVITRYKKIEKEKSGSTAEPHQQEVVPWQLYAFIISAVILLFLLAGAFVIGTLWYFYGEEWSWQTVTDTLKLNQSSQVVMGSS